MIYHRILDNFNWKDKDQKNNMPCYSKKKDYLNLKMNSKFKERYNYKGKKCQKGKNRFIYNINNNLMK